VALGQGAAVVYLTTERGDTIMHNNLGVRQDVREAFRDLEQLDRRRRLTRV